MPAGRGKKQGSGPANFVRPRRAAIIAVPPARMLDVVGLAEVFADAYKVHGGEPAYQVETVAAGEDRSVPTQIGLPILAHQTFREMRGPVADFLRRLREQNTSARRLGSVCTGALVLADAGLLNGRPATTHWHWCNELIQKHPSVKVDADRIYIRDKNIYTSAGVTAGIDLALALVEEDLGPSVALQVARRMVVFLLRPRGGNSKPLPRCRGSCLCQRIQQCGGSAAHVRPPIARDTGAV